MPGVGAAISAAWGAFTASGVGAFLTGSIGGRLLVTVATTALMRQSVKPKDPGFSAKITQTGADNPLAVILGTYATGGVRFAPPMSHGNAGKTKNAYATFAFVVCAAPGAQLRRIAIEGEWVELGTDPHPDYGLPVLGEYEDRAWIRYYDGSQTTADPMMLAKYGDHPDYPWSADMVGAGLCLAYVTCRYDRDLFPSPEPRMLFELSGIPLYDPRRDDTAGGSGPHRWGDPSTWEASDNLVVQAYNVARGIALFNGDVWGGAYDAEDLPLATWIAAMNAGDIDEGGVPRWRGGYEAAVSDKPKEVIEELLKGCGGDATEAAGQLLVRVGGPGLPVAFITDDDWLITRDQTETPFPSVTTTYNGARASYPEPDSLYAPEDAPARIVPAYEAEDGGRRNLADLSYPAVPYVDQVQRLVYALVEDNRRFRRHAGTLPGAAAMLDPMDTIAWTSERYGYDAKVFEIAEISDDLRRCIARVSLLERDPGDWDVPAEAIRPVTPAGSNATPPDALDVPGFTVAGISIEDGDEVARRPAIAITWDGADLDGVSGLRWSIRDATSGALVNVGETSAVAGGEAIVAAGVMPDQTYVVQAELIAGVPTAPALPAFVTTPDTRLGLADLSDELRAQIDAAYTRHDAALEEATGTVAALRDAALAAYGPLDGITTPLADRLGAAEGSITAQDTSIATLQASLTSAQGDIAANGTALAEIGTRITTAEGAITTQSTTLTQLQADLTSAQGDITGNATAISGLDTRVTWAEGDLSALASSVTALQTTVGGNSAAITELQATGLDASAAVAAVETEISAEYGSLTALATATAFAEATATGLQSGYVWSLGGDNVLSLVRVDDGSAPTTTARIKGDYIRLDGNTEVMGDFAIRSGTTGARVEIQPDRISVYDESGALVVVLGNLTGV